MRHAEHFWSLVPFVGDVQMDGRSYGARLLRLVDGDRSHGGREGTRLAIQEVVFRQKKDLLLSRVRS